MAISILELTYLQMFSLAEIHGRLHRPEAEKDLFTYSPTYRLVQDCPERFYKVNLVTNLA